MTGLNAIKGASERTERLLDINATLRKCREQDVQDVKGWDDQWVNWDDLGGGDPGWGDISG